MGPSSGGLFVISKRTTRLYNEFHALIVASGKDKHARLA